MNKGIIQLSLAGAFSAIYAKYCIEHIKTYAVVRDQIKKDIEEIQESTEGYSEEDRAEDLLYLNIMTAVQVSAYALPLVASTALAANGWKNIKKGIK